MDFRVLHWGVLDGTCSLVSSLEYLVSNGRQVLLGDIGLGGSATHIGGTVMFRRDGGGSGELGYGMSTYDLG